MKLKEILIVHHSHTDWGFTTHPAQAARLHGKFLDQAAQLCQRYADAPDELRFRWTCESAHAVQLFLDQAAPLSRRRFLAMVEAGLIEVTGAALCPTPNNDAPTIRAALDIVESMRRRYDIPISTAMFSDINGLNWPWASALLDYGLPHVLMAMNFCCGGGMPRHTHFNWLTPERRVLRVWHGQHYNFGAYWGLNCDSFSMEQVVPQRLAELHDYPREKLLLQVTNIPADNMGPHPQMLTYIRRYNDLAERHDWPRMRTALPKDWFAWLIPTEPIPPSYSGDWTDWWATVLNQTPAATSAAREAARRLELAQRWLPFLAPRDKRRLAAHLQEVYRQLYLANEHTTGSSQSVRAPDSYAALAGVAAHDDLCYRVLYEATALLRAILNAYGSSTHRSIGLFDPELESFDPAWIAIVSGQDKSPAPSIHLLPSPDNTPLFPLSSAPPPSVSREEIAPWTYLDNGMIRLGLCREQNSLSLQTRSVPGRELLGCSPDGYFGQIVYERPPHNHRSDWYDVSGGLGCDMQNGLVAWPKTVWQRTPFTAAAEPSADAAAAGFFMRRLQGPDGLQAQLTLSLIPDQPGFDMDYRLDIPFSCDPRSFYILFPFTFAPDEIRAEIGGVWMNPRCDYLPGSCRSWLTVHKGLLASAQEISLLWQPFDAPLVMLDAICPHPSQADNPRRQACWISWPAHNYWFTNAPGRLGGCLRFRYRIIIWNTYVACKEAEAFMAAVMWPTSLQAKSGNVY